MTASQLEFASPSPTISVKSAFAPQRAQATEPKVWDSPLERYEDIKRSHEQQAAEQGGRQRRWDAAETNRLNQSQWCGVQATPINADILYSYETLVGRCRHEYYNNPMVEGVLNTFAIDVVGERGPTLIIESDDDDYDTVAKQVWTNFFNQCEVSGIPGPDLLRRLVIQDGHTGNWLHQFIDLSNELPSSEPIKTRLLDLDPLRLQTPHMFAGSRRIVNGIERDRLGRPVRYFIRKPEDQFASPFFDWNQNYDPISADDIMHTFWSREPGQALGFPRLASVLQEIAELRDFDAQVMDSARSAANNGMLLYTKMPELVAENARVFSGTIRLERQVAKAVPPGYEIAGQTPTQPAAHYVDFRHERLRSLGRPWNMPLLMVLLSAEDSNFSQSRIDLNVIYQRAVNAYQNFIENNWLNKLLRIAFREAGLAFKPGKTQNDSNPFLMPKRPEKVEMRWGWDPIEQANELDHTKNQIERIKWGLSCPADEVATDGKTEDAILDSLAKTNEKRIKRGLPPLPGPDVPRGNQESDEKTEQNQTPPPRATGKSTPAKRRENRRRRSRATVNA